MICVLSGIASHAADESAETKSIDPIAIEKTLIAELEPEFTVVLEGKAVTADVSKDADGGVYVRAEPIFEALNDEFEYNTDEGVLIVQRSQDGVVMELYTDTGIVKANGRALGKLQNFGDIAEGKINLTPNAIAVMSGAIGKIDEGEQQINFELDPRLKVATGFEMFVNDIPLGNLEPGPKAVGSVMLLPLHPIAKELGHNVQIIDGGASIKVRRSQDSAEFELNLDTGLVKLNGKPVGVTKDVTYIDKTNLLLPISAIEALTGTHVDILGSSSRIDITLDDRLKGAVKPGARIDDTVKSAPFVVEAIEFHTGTDTQNTASAEFSVQGFNGKVRYEIPDLPTNIAEAEPSWVSLDYAHVNGGYGAIGDYSADFRELDGVGLRRVRGASFTKETEEGRWALAAGVPVSGSRKISEDQSRLEFGGLAAGARYASKEGWEAGLSYKMEGASDDQMAVLSAISGRLGRGRDKPLTWDARADIGGFSGPARESNIDVRGSLNTRYEVNKNINIDAYASYDGAEFLRADLDEEDKQDAIQASQDSEDSNANQDGTQTLAPDVRVRGKDVFTYGGAVQIAARKDMGPLKRPAVSARYSKTTSGAFTGSGAKTSVDNYGVSFNTSLQKVGTNVSLDFAGYQQKLPGGLTETGDQLTARILQDVKYATVRAQYSSIRKNDLPREERLDGQITAKPYKLGLPRDAALRVAPSVAASLSDKDTSVRAGVVANFDSGELLGKKTKMQASFGVLQNFSGEAGDKSDTFLTVSIGRKLRLSKNLTLGMSYRNDLHGEQRVGVFLDGRFGLHEKRRFKTAKDGRGVLKGRAFFDKNRDGIKQDDEPAVGGALIRIKGTRLALRTDSGGYYTIQNIKKGLHDLRIDGRSLPLGFSLADDTATRASIYEGHITEINLPIVQRGQIRGFAYVDADGDGVYTKGEKRLEGAKLTLKNLEKSDAIFNVYSASFGQYAFDDLPAGRYEMVIAKTNAPDSAPEAPVIIELTASNDLMLKQNIAAAPTQVTRAAEQNSEPKETGERIVGRKEEVPPPDIRESDPAP